LLRQQCCHGSKQVLRCWLYSLKHNNADTWFTLLNTTLALYVLGNLIIQHCKRTDLHGPSAPVTLYYLAAMLCQQF
jgi:hypothetical protein